MTACFTLLPVRLGQFALLLSIVFFAGCAAKTPTTAQQQKTFPHHPVLSLAQSPQQALSAEKKRSPFSVSGGWGYDKAGAFLLAAPAGRGQGHYNNTVPLENALVGLRNTVEFSATPAQGERYVVIDYGPITRTISLRDDRMYAVWKLNLYIVSERLHTSLYNTALKQPLDQRLSAATRAVARIVPREYWFDVTGTFNFNPKKQKDHKKQEQQPRA